MLNKKVAVITVTSARRHGEAPPLTHAQHLTVFEELLHALPVLIHRTALRDRMRVRRRDGRRGVCHEYVGLLVLEQNAELSQGSGWALKDL